MYIRLVGLLSRKINEKIMIVKVKEKIEKDMKVDFPSYWVDTSHGMKDSFLFFASEDIGLCITNGLNAERKPSAHFIEWQNLVPANETEITRMKELFIENQKRHKAIMFPELPTYPIMDDNNDISILEGESLKKESDGN